MRARKALSEARETVSVRDEIPADDVVEDAMPASEEAPRSGRVCVECGGDGHARDGCEHREIVLLHAASTAAREAIARLERARAEQRAAARALRALAMEEIKRGRAERVTSPAAVSEPAIEWEPPASMPVEAPRAEGPCP